MLKLSYIPFLLRLNAREFLADKKVFALSVTLVILNNLAWFLVWVLLFNAVGSLRGWGLADVARLAGISTMGYGLAFGLCGGLWHLYKNITDGTLDVFLTYPKPPLATIALSQPDTDALGDALSGLLTVIIFGQVTFGETLGAMALTLPVMVIILAACLMLNSLSFWTKDRSGFMEQTLDSFVQASTFPIHGLPLAIKILLFTVLPVGFIGFLPADIVRQFAWWKVGVLILAAGVFMCLAVWIFNRGLRRYTSGNQMTELR